MGDGPPPEDFDYGEQREDGQYENYPTTDKGEFVQDVRRTYVHEECGTETTMTVTLAESVARDPTQYGKTFCAGCEEHVPVSEVRWKKDGQPWVVPDDNSDDDPDHELNKSLCRLESCLLNTTTVAEREGAPTFARLCETWAHTVYLTRCDTDPTVDAGPLSLMDYLDHVGTEGFDDA